MTDIQPQERPSNLPDKLRGIASVTSKTGAVYTVNFDTGVCDCQHGDAWRWQSKRWVPANLCNHKLKAIASLIDSGETSLQEFYEYSVGKRVNAFVCVSAFHKELRRGDTEKALYWGRCMVPHRGRHGVIAYMRNILFEETRDLQLARTILRLSDHGRSVTQLDVDRAIKRFCYAPKKWELPWRYSIFIDEQKGYKRLAHKFGYDVAKPKDIIPAKNTKDLQQAIIYGFEIADRPTMQYGLKGWFKSQSKNHDNMKIEMFNLLVDVHNGLFKNGFRHNPDHADEIQSIVLKRINGHGSPGYHELNAYADALSDPYEGDSDAAVPSLTHKRIMNSPSAYAFPAGELRAVPIYAHDNHTWHGKALMKAYMAQLQPGAVQDKLDFRLCGAYMGVAWRTLAFKQHGTINVPWEKVSWRSPNWLWGHLDKMWY
jgi:hypothetical protein